MQESVSRPVKGAATSQGLWAMAEPNGHVCTWGLAWREAERQALMILIGDEDDRPIAPIRHGHNSTTCLSQRNAQGDSGRSGGDGRVDGDGTALRPFDGLLTCRRARSAPSSPGPNSLLLLEVGCSRGGTWVYTLRPPPSRQASSSVSQRFMLTAAGSA